MGGTCCGAPKAGQGEDADAVAVDKAGKIQRMEKKQKKQEQKQMKKEIKQELKEMKKEQKELAKQGSALKPESKKDAKKAIAEKLQFKKETLEHHQLPVPGKSIMVPTKALNTAKDLALAHTPGVAEPCLAIAKQRELASKYTNKGRTIACVSNGTSVLGLGDIGALAAKPDLEGKAALFKQFAGVDCVDLCVDTPDRKKFINVVKHLAPSFGGVSLESLKAPDCFEIEAELKAHMPIPVFHNDQHGTAAVCLAGLTNALSIKGKSLKDVKIVCNGAGAGGIACMRLLLAAGASPENCFLCDTRGVIYAGRAAGMNEYKAALANPTITARTTLEQVCEGADVLIGLSAANVFTEQIMMSLNEDPIVFALSNPTPEIQPAQAKELRPDCITATARPEHANQINNVMCGPFVFRAVLDTVSTEVNEAMILAAAEAIAELAREPVHRAVAAAWPGRDFEFGPDYFLPSPLDPRLLDKITCKVAEVAAETGVAKHPIKDFNSYRAYLGGIAQAGDQAHFVTGG